MENFKKTSASDPELNLEQADRILKNVFAANHTEYNTIPLEVLTSYCNYRKERFSIQKIIILIVMVLFLMLPILFIPPEFSVCRDGGDSKMNPTYTLEVTSRVPVERIHASIDGRSVPVYEVAAHTYSVEPSVNGLMLITVTLINNQTDTQYIEVTDIDFEAPVLVSNDMDNEYIYLYLSDTGTGIDYAKIEAAGMDGQLQSPSSYNEKTGCVVFPYPKNPLNIYIPDFAGNRLHLVLTIKK